MFRTRSGPVRRSVTPPRASLDPRVGSRAFLRNGAGAMSPSMSTMQSPHACRSMSPSMRSPSMRSPPARLASTYADARVKERALDLPANALDLTAAASEERHFEFMQGRSYADAVYANRTKGATRKHLVLAAADSDNALACNDSLRREAAAAIVALEEATQNYSDALETRNREEARRIRSNEVVCGLEKVVERNATSLAVAQRAVKSACATESEAKYALDQAERQLITDEAEEQASLATLQTAQKEHEMSIQEMIAAYQAMRKAEDDCLEAQQKEFELLQQEGMKCVARQCAANASSFVGQCMRNTDAKAQEASAIAAGRAAAGDPSGIPFAAEAVGNAAIDENNKTTAVTAYDKAKEEYDNAVHDAAEATRNRREKEQELNDKTGKYHVISEKEKRDYGVVATCEKRHDDAVFKLQESRQEYAKADRWHQKCKATREEREREEENLAQVHSELLEELKSAREIFHQCMQLCEHENGICIECGTELARERQYSQNVREFAAVGWEDEAVCRYGERLRRLEDMWATMQCSLQEDALANRTDNLAEAAKRRGAAQDGYVHRERALEAEFERANQLKVIATQDQILDREQALAQQVALDAEMVRYGARRIHRYPAEVHAYPAEFDGYPAEFDAYPADLYAYEDERRRFHDLDPRMCRATRLNMGCGGARAARFL